MTMQSLSPAARPSRLTYRTREEIAGWLLAGPWIDHNFRFLSYGDACLLFQQD